MYVTFFHYGPKKYKKAYTAFLEEFAKTGDGDAAAKKHIHSLDQDKMQKDCARFIQKHLKVLKK